MRRRLTTTRSTRARPALTLVELLVVVAIMSTLMSILLTTLSSVRNSAKSVLCKNKLQGVAQAFQMFADDYAHGDRGRESNRLGGNRFRLEDFQDSLYGTEEFIKGDATQVNKVTFEARKQPLICPAGPRGLGHDGTIQPAELSILPLENVSIGFNMRLHMGNIKINYGTIQLDSLRSVTLSPRILNHPWTPLAFDVDGMSAQNRPQPLVPFYSTPPAAQSGLYTSGKFWFPAGRHAGQVHAAFIGGHVWSSRNPATAPGWDWAYQPPPDENE
ncbi:MAG: hypothetical protein GXP29_04025 [Planctomycetes bacterium]|nr:hypothetical protein [Planctomycetota bacterium]